MESLSQDVMRSFTNFRNGTSIIQVTFNSQLPLPHYPITKFPPLFLGLSIIQVILDLQLPAVPKVLDKPQPDS